MGIYWTEDNIVEELVGEFGEEFAEEIKESLDLEGGYSVYGDAGIVTINGRDYHIIKNEEEAEYIAQKYVKNIIGEEPELFDLDILSDYVYISDTDKREILIEEESHIREEIINETGKEANEWEIERRLNELKTGLANPVRYFVEEQGVHTLETLLKQPFIQIDIDRLAIDAVEMYGWEHFLSQYDSSYKTTKNGIVYFREE